MINHRMFSKLIAVLICIALCPLVLAQSIPDGPYLGQEPPDLEPEKFAPGIITLSNREEWTGTFTPDGQEFYFSVSDPGWTGYQLLVMRQQDGIWSEPMRLPFSSETYVDIWMHLSPDGQKLFFTSSRPSELWLDINVWMSERQGSDWSEPVKLGFSYSGRDYGGNCAQNGTYYFASERSGNIGIYRSIPVAGEYTTAERLPSPVNIGQHEQCPWIAPDESYLIFVSDRGSTRDLYISYKNQDDSWKEPINLGSRINSQKLEWNPSISPDGRYLFFSRSTGQTNDPQNLDLYWVSTKSFLPDPNGTIYNFRSEQRFSSIQVAINYADAGDTIVIEPGVYHENIVLDKDITLQSIDPNDPYYIGGTIIQGDPNEPVVTLNGNSEICTLAGLTLRAGSVGVKGTTTFATLLNCRIVDNATDGLELFKGSEPLLYHCLITANTRAGIMMHVSTGRTILYCRPIIENSYIVDNTEGSLIDGQPVIVNSIIEGQ